VTNIINSFCETQIQTKNK